jgi:hypothetical protein
MITTPFEVKMYSPAGRDYPERTIALFLADIEQEVIVGCFGEAFYDYLKSKLTPIPANLLEYEEGRDYVLDEMVMYRGLVFKSTVNCNRTHPKDLDSDWDVVSKFTDDCANELWYKGLAKMIALRAYRNALFYDTYHSTAGGIVVNVAEGFNQSYRAAVKPELEAICRQLDNDFDMVKKGVMKLINKLKKDADCKALVSTLSTCLPEIESCTRKSGRRIAFRV